MPRVELVGNEVVEVLQGARYVDEGAKGYDDNDQQVPVECLLDSVNINTPGIYYVRYGIKDTSGSVLADARRIVVVMSLAPSPEPTAADPDQVPASPRSEAPAPPASPPQPPPPPVERGPGSFWGRMGDIPLAIVAFAVLALAVTAGFLAISQVVKPDPVHLGLFEIGSNARDVGLRFLESDKTLEFRIGSLATQPAPISDEAEAEKSPATPAIPVPASRPAPASGPH